MWVPAASGTYPAHHPPHHTYSKPPPRASCSALPEWDRTQASSVSDSLLGPDTACRLLSVLWLAACSSAARPAARSGSCRRGIRADCIPIRPCAGPAVRPQAAVCILVRSCDALCMRKKARPPSRGKAAGWGRRGPGCTLVAWGGAVRGPCYTSADRFGQWLGKLIPARRCGLMDPVRLLSLVNL